MKPNKSYSVKLQITSVKKGKPVMESPTARIRKKLNQIIKDGFAVQVPYGEIEDAIMDVISDERYL